MSDDLVKMCRRLSRYAHAQLSATDLERIANRIEELEKGFWNLHREYDKRGNRIEKLEAKLAKAVEALEFYADADNYEDQHKPESCGCCYYLHDAEVKEDEGAKARTALAELKGETDGCQ
jgi:predicted RNase H-like nuclease (RuvC/YqgF family)